MNSTERFASHIARVDWPRVIARLDSGDSCRLLFAAVWEIIRGLEFINDVSDPFVADTQYAITEYHDAECGRAARALLAMLKPLREGIAAERLRLLAMDEGAQP